MEFGDWRLRAAGGGRWGGVWPPTCKYPQSPRERTEQGEDLGHREGSSEKRPRMQVEGNRPRDERQAQVEPHEDKHGQHQATDERERGPGGEVERGCGGERGSEEQGGARMEDGEWRMEIGDCRLQIADCRLQKRWCGMTFVPSSLPASCFLLPPSTFLLPSSSFLLPPPPHQTRQAAQRNHRQSP